MRVRFSELEGRRIGVWGAGREITSLARQVASRLADAHIAVAAFDAIPERDLAQLAMPAAKVVLAADAAAALGDCDVIVRSPGVSLYRPELQILREAGVPITTATGLWLAECGGEGVIGVTGTKGKSTTAALAGHLARAAGRTVALVGNIGVPALDLLDAPAADVTVVELSSYQIADLARGPEVALVTNVFREHTDWHGSEQRYRADKLRLLSLPGVRAGVLNGRDHALAAIGGDSGLDLRFYGVPGGWDVQDGWLSLLAERRCELRELPLLGEHNALNLCGALAALEALAIAPPPLPGSLDGFRGLSHRLEAFAENGGVLWVDDSISTTPESTIAALASFPGREIVLIGGGQDRGQDYEALGRALCARGASVIGVPSTGARMIAAARAAGVADERAIEAGDMEHAVGCALALAGSEGVVLLSPAAPSYDHYRDFEERGERFRALADARLRQGPRA